MLERVTDQLKISGTNIAVQFTCAHLDRPPNGFFLMHRCDCPYVTANLSDTGVSAVEAWICLNLRETEYTDHVRSVPPLYE